MLNTIVERLTSAEFIEALLCSVAGMAGIFIVVGVIILSIALLNKIGAISDKNNDKE